LDTLALGALFSKSSSVAVAQHDKLHGFLILTFRKA